MKHHLPACKTVLTPSLSKLDCLTALMRRVRDNQALCPTGEQELEARAVRFGNLPSKQAAVALLPALGNAVPGPWAEH